METHTHACIAYIIGRVIAGKRVTSIYDYSQSCEIDRSGLPDTRCLREFSFANWAYLTASPSISRYQYACSAGHSFDLAVKGNSFIGYIKESESHFIGTVRGDSVYLYDQKKAEHFNYRISGNAIGH
jgi:hypothetical protein